jgi:hypothetical protein
VDGFDLPQELSLEVVYVDEHLMELEATVCTGDWRGRAKTYTVPTDVAAFAAALQRFADGAAGAAEFTAGAGTGIGLIALRFYRIDRAGHIAGHASLATDDVATDHRPEQISRLAVEFGAEAWPLSQFAAELGELAATQSGRVSMTISTLTGR